MADFGDFLKELEGAVAGGSMPPAANTITAPTASSDLNSYLANLRSMLETAPAPATGVHSAEQNSRQTAPAPDQYFANLRNMLQTPAVAEQTATAPAPDQYLANLRNMLQTPTGVQSAEQTSRQTPAPVAAPAPAPVVNSTPQKPGRRLKFMLISTHCHQVTGYSKVSYGLLKELAKQPFLDVIHYGFQRFPNKDFSDTRPYPAGVQVIDALSLEAANTASQGPKAGFGYAELPAKIQEIRPDVIMIYNDMSVINQFMEHIKKSGIKRNFSTWLYVDQVYNCQLNGYLEVINREADRVFTFTKEWKDCLKDQGIHRPIDVIGHGFDARMFPSMPKAMARKRLGLPEDIFIFMSLNRNQPRKRYDLLIMAFVELLVKYPTKPLTLMCVCDKGEKGGWWLFEIFVRELKLRNVPVDRFANRLMVTQRDMDFKDEEINALYNAADVGISAADGEGWGLCTFEQMGVGIPQIVPALGGYREFCTAENSVLVKPKHRFYLPMAFSPVGGEATAVDPHDLCLGMETYVNDSTLREKHAAAGKAKVATYTWAEAAKGLVRRLKTRWEDDE